MAGSRLTEFPGSRGRIVVHEWPREHPRYVALIAHGYGEHAQRYAHVAEHLVRHGASVYAPDHLGHGRSEGERALVDSVDDMVADLDAVARKAAADHPGQPLVLIGHSMGGLIATRYAQQHGGKLAALVLSAPAVQARHTGRDGGGGKGERRGTVGRSTAGALAARRGRRAGPDRRGTARG